MDHSLAESQLKQSAGSQSRLAMLTADNVEPALAAMLTSMDALDSRVRIVTERSGNILAAGRDLDHWLGRSDCLWLKANRLTAFDRGAQLLLDNLFRVEIGHVETQILRRRQEEGHCILQSVGLCPDAVAVTMQLAHPEFEPRLVNLEVAFGLTPSESHIVELLHLGLGPQEIGGALGISVHTVRAHLRHCYEKLDVSTREELWRKLAPYRLA